MLDIVKLDEALKLKSAARLYETKHPFLKLIKAKINFSNHFFINSPISFERYSLHCVKLLRVARTKQLHEMSNIDSLKFAQLVRNIRIEKLVNNVGKNSISYFNLRLQNKTRLRDLTLNEIESISRFIERKSLPVIKEACRMRGIRQFDERELEELEMTMCYGSRIIDLRHTTSKVIRTLEGDNDPICVYKIGAILNVQEAINWGHALSKVTSVKHRNTLLRVAHGDIYSNERLARFGLIENPNCPRCGELDTTDHKLITCDYISRIWEKALCTTDTLRYSPTDQEQIENRILGAPIGTHPLILTIHAELIQRILSLKADANFLIRPKKLVSLAIKSVLYCEKDQRLKALCYDLLESMERN